MAPNPNLKKQQPTYLRDVRRDAHGRLEYFYDSTGWYQNGAYHLRRRWFYHGKWYERTWQWAADQRQVYLLHTQGHQGNKALRNVNQAGNAVAKIRPDAAAMVVSLEAVWIKKVVAILKSA